eukprot:11610789-Alexandrium_andersonii.AAC.1
MSTGACSLPLVHVLSARAQALTRAQCVRMARQGARVKPCVAGASRFGAEAKQGLLRPVAKGCGRAWGVTESRIAHG